MNQTLAKRSEVDKKHKEVLINWVNNQNIKTNKNQITDRITDKNSIIYIVFGRITVLGLDFVLLISSHKTDWSKHDLELPEGSQTAETIDK